MKSFKKILCLGNSESDRKQIFVIIKPGFLQYQQGIIDIFIKNNWSISKLRTKQLLLREAQDLYKMHVNEPFYKDLCKYMSSGPSVGILFTKPKRTTEVTIRSVDKIKDLIRSKWGFNEMRNVLHSSDSVENVKRESNIYFK